MEKLIPTIWVTKYNDKQVKFKCPWCKRTHYHGFGEGMYKEPGSHRVSHCTKEPTEFNGYYLRLKEEKFKYKLEGFKSKSQKESRKKVLPLDLIRKDKYGI